MSVAVSIPVRRRPFGAYDDPRLPTGIWVASGALIGDGGGGVNQVRCNFAAADQVRTQDMFSLEQLSIIVNENSDRVARVLTQNLDSDMTPPGTAAAVNQAWSVRMVSDGVQTNLDARDQDALHGIFLGRQFAPNTVTAVTIITVNVNLVTASIRAQGYVWGPRSVSIPEGPARPVLSIFRP